MSSSAWSVAFMNMRALLWRCLSSSAVGGSVMPSMMEFIQGRSTEGNALATSKGQAHQDQLRTFKCH
eukprot:10480293-Heterocapsa_arctica.AAC.1